MCFEVSRILQCGYLVIVGVLDNDRKFLYLRTVEVGAFWMMGFLAAGG